MRQILLGGLIVLVLGSVLAFGPDRPRAAEVAAGGAHSENRAADTSDKKEPSPEEKMRRRFPQPARVGDLIGLPILDWQDSTIGYVRQIVRTPAGKVQLIVPYNAWFGWLRFGGIDGARRPVAVPIEVVAILGRQIAALDMPRKDFDAAPTFVETQATPLGPDEMITIAITRR